MTESIFVEYFGRTSIAKVLDFLIVGRDFDYSITDIARGACVGWSAFMRIWKFLVAKKVVVFTRKVGRAELYKLNVADPTVASLVRLYWEITKSETEKSLKIPIAVKAR